MMAYFAALVKLPGLAAGRFNETPFPEERPAGAPDGGIWAEFVEIGLL